MKAHIYASVKGRERERKKKERKRKKEGTHLKSLTSPFNKENRRFIPEAMKQWIMFIIWRAHSIVINVKMNFRQLILSWTGGYNLADSNQVLSILKRAYNMDEL